jgi:hypothetical protein
MLKLKTLRAADQARHRDSLRAAFGAGLAKALAKLRPPQSYDEDLIDFLESVLDKILIGSPDELECVALAVQGMYPAFSAYAARSKKGKALKDMVHRNTLAIVEACFDYDKFSEKRPGWTAYALVCAHKLRICPYCHAHHVNYHVDPGAASTRKQYVIRPPLDHFLPKSRYPYLAVSLSNLVPSCVPCNSSIKSSANPLETGLASPHDMSKPIAVRFSAVGSIPGVITGTVDDVRITLHIEDEHSQILVDAFLLRERYQWYRHEIKDLIDRFEDHRGIPEELRGLVPRDRYVLGCAAHNVEERALGLCLSHVYAELTKGEVVGA